MKKPDQQYPTPPATSPRSTQSPKPIEKDPVIEKDDAISEKLESGVAKTTEEPQGTKPAVSWRDQLKDIVAEDKVKPIDETPTRPEVITYPKDDRSPKQAKTKFWEANEGLKESLPDDDVKKINKVLGSAKLITDTHQKYIDKILGNDVKVNTGEVKHEGTIDDRLNEVSEALDEAKVDETEPDIPMVDKDTNIDEEPTDIEIITSLS